MIPDWRQSTAIAGVGAVVLAVVLLASGGAGASLERLAEGAAWIVALLGLLVALREIRRGGTSVQSALAGFDADVEGPATDEPLTGAALEETVADAIRRARSAGRVDAGIAAIRPHLRETVVAVIVAGGASRREALHAVATGRWSADAEAAAVLAERPAPPGRTFSRRLAIWLFPGDALEHRLERTVRAIERLAGDELSTLPGQRAPRTVPVHRRLPAEDAGVYIERSGASHEGAAHSSDPDPDPPGDLTATTRRSTGAVTPDGSADGRASDRDRIADVEVRRP